MNHINPDFDPARRNVQPPTPPIPQQRTAEPRTGQRAAWRTTRNAAGWILREARNERTGSDFRPAVTALLVSLQKLGITVKLPPPEVPDQHQPKPPLTERELQVLHGLSQGKSNADIGRELFLSEETIKTHARRLYRKLAVQYRAHAVAFGFRTGLLS